MRLNATSVAVSTKLGDLILKFIARVISDGRVTIPEEIRKLLGIRSGDFVSCEVESIESHVAPNPDPQTGSRTNSEQ